MSNKGIHNTPSAAHLSRYIGSSPEATAKNIIEVRDSTFGFSVDPSRRYLIKLFAGASYDLLLSNAKKETNKLHRTMIIEVLLLGKQFLEEFKTGWFKIVPEMRCSFSKSISVPVKPLGLMLIDDKITAVFSPLWKTIGLTVDQFRICASLIKSGYLDVNPDVDDFLWLEMSAPGKGLPRELAVRGLETVDLLTDLEFAGVRMNVEAAMEIVASVPRKKRERKIDPRQGDFGFPKE